VASLDSPDALAARLLPLCGEGLQLEMLSNRGMKVWPGGMAETFTVDVYRCRFQLPETPGAVIGHEAITRLLDRITSAGLEFVKLEGLYTFDDIPGFSRGQGQ
jgi:isocitrate dehydrogenase